MVLFSLLFVTSSYSQDTTGNGYQIRVELPGINDTTLILAHRYGNKFFTDDTIRTDHHGTSVFKGSQPLPWGMYQIVLPDRSFFDFFIDSDQQMTLRSKPGDFVSNNIALGHKLNQLLFDWHRATIAYKGKPEMKVVWDTTLQRAGYSLVGKFLRGLQPFQVPPILANNQDWQKNKTA
ncbi:MAG: DUF4369 domain-containing protein, partial [Bacteroidales bacterium]|nr:DUF4369 domain-containing protein [Bacteroidales bacterium]